MQNWKPFRKANDMPFKRLSIKILYYSQYHFVIRYIQWISKGRYTLLWGLSGINLWVFVTYFPFSVSLVMKNLRSTKLTKRKLRVIYNNSRCKIAFSLGYKIHTRQKLYPLLFATFYYISIICRNFFFFFKSVNLRKSH